PCQHSDSVFAGLPARFGGSPVISNLCSRPKPGPEATVFSAPSTDSPAHTPRTVGWHSSSVLDSAASQIRTSASSPQTRAPPSSAPSTWFGSSPAPLRQYDPCSGSADECSPGPEARTPGSLRSVRDKPDPHTRVSSPCNRSGSTAESATLAAVATAVWMIFVLLSTPTCAFIPKYHCLPFFVWCISGSRCCSRFLVEVGACRMAASTIVPVVIRTPCACKCRFTCPKICSPSWCASSKCRNLHTVVSSGTGSQPRSMPTNCRITTESYSASSTAGSDRLNHC